MYMPAPVKTLLLALIAVCPPALAVDDGEAFGAWTTRCVDNDRGGQACHVFQHVVVEGDGAREKAVNMSIGFPPQAEQPVTVLRLPLGLWLLRGITLQVDDQTTRQLPVEVCATGGCQTTLRIAPDVRDELEAGKQLIVTTWNLRKQPVRVPIELDGLSAALKALQKQAAGHPTPD